MATANQKTPSFQVGDRVRFQLGRRKVSGKIVEDRGPIGVGGRRLYIVHLFRDPDEPAPFLMPAEELEAEKDGGPWGKTIEKAKVLDYLKNGGLWSILRSNS